MLMQKITPCLWFDKQAEEAANFYISVFSGSAFGGRIGNISRYGKEGHAIHKMPEGLVMTVEFELAGQTFTALNGGPVFKFNEAVSFQVYCDSQKEIDYFWGKLSADPKSEQCGWLKDKFGVSWQIVPTILDELMSRDKLGNVMRVFLPMKKIDIEALKKASEGK